MIRIKLFPFFVVARFNFHHKPLDKLTDSEILEFIYTELEKEKYKKIQLSDSTIALEGDHSGIYFNIKPIRVATQAIDYGDISIEHRSNKRKIVFKYQSTIYPLLNLIFGIVISILSKDIKIGIFVFLSTFIILWLWVYVIQMMTISGCIDKLEYNEHCRDKGNPNDR